MKTITCVCGESVEVTEHAVSAVCPACKTLIRISDGTVKYSTPTPPKDSAAVSDARKTETPN